MNKIIMKGFRVLVELPFSYFVLWLCKVGLRVIELRRDGKLNKWVLLKGCLLMVVITFGITWLNRR